MVISCSHQAPWLLSKSAKPMRTVRQEAPTARATDVVGRATSTTPDHTCVASIIPAASRAPPRCHRNVLIWIFAACCIAHLFCVLPLVCILCIASVATASHSSFTLATIGGRALLRGDDGEEQFSLARTEGFSLADALQRAAFAAPSKW